MFNTRNLYRKADTKLETFGLIFDIDGVVVGSTAYQIAAWQRLCSEREVDLASTEVAARACGTATEIASRLFGNRLGDKELALIVERHTELFCELYRPHMRLIDGLKKFLDDARSANLPMALVSNNNTQIIHFLLDSLYLNSYFKVHVTAEDIDRGKPYPDAHLKAALRLGLMPEDCIAFEGSEAGLDAALRAGIKAFFVQTSDNTPALNQPNLIQQIADYRTLRPPLAYTYSKMIAL